VAGGFVIAPSARVRFRETPSSPSSCRRSRLSFARARPISEAWRARAWSGTRRRGAARPGWCPPSPAWLRGRAAPTSSRTPCRQVRRCSPEGQL